MNASKTKQVICVFCGSKCGTNPHFESTARALGQYIGKNKFDLVFGGGGTGLMGIVSQSALQAGATVTGIIPEILLNTETPKENLSKIHIVSNMSERKKMMSDYADMFIALPGGIGTYEEVFEVLTNNWLGVFNKPLGFLDVDNFYKNLFFFFDEAQKNGFIHPECRKLIHYGTNIDDLVRELKDSI